MTKKVMKLLDKRTGLMECKVCGTEHYANLHVYENGTFYKRGSWQCPQGCSLD